MVEVSRIRSRIVPYVVCLALAAMFVVASPQPEARAHTGYSDATMSGCWWGGQHFQSGSYLRAHTWQVTFPSNDCRLLEVKAYSKNTNGTWNSSSQSTTLDSIWASVPWRTTHCSDHNAKNALGTYLGFRLQDGGCTI